MYDFLKLKKEVSETTSDIDPDDVWTLKNKLKGLGYYKEPEWGITKFVDNEMFDGIRKFQTDNKLKVDGVIKPEGETESKVNERIKNNTWGNATKEALDNYVKNYKDYPGKTNTGIMAPYKDMVRNFGDMNRLGLEGADKFFHCKGNYEAAKRGLWGKTVASTISAAKEVKDIFKYGLNDSITDWRANQRGWKGAKEGKSLSETCPTQPRKYK